MLLKTAVSTRQLTPTVYRPSSLNPPCSAVSSLYQTNTSNVLLHIAFISIASKNALLQTMMLQTQMQKTISQFFYITVCCDVYLSSVSQW